MQKMDALWTMPLLHIAINHSNNSPIVASTPTSKWHCQESNPWYHQGQKETDAACHAKMSKCSQFGITATCAVLCSKHLQHGTSIEQWNFQIEKVHKYMCRGPYEGSLYICMPSVCIANCDHHRQHHIMVVTMCMIGAKFRSKPISCMEHVPGAQLATDLILLQCHYCFHNF